MLSALHVVGFLLLFLIRFSKSLPQNTFRVLILALSGCTSTHDMKDGTESFWGGGYLVEELSDSEYRITAKSNVAQWANYSAARQMWEQHAQEACGDRSHVERDVREYDYQDAPNFLWNRYIVAVKEGIAVCMSDDDRIVKKEPE